MRIILFTSIIVLLSCDKENIDGYFYDGFLNGESFLINKDVSAVLEISDTKNIGALIFECYNQAGFLKEQLVIMSFKISSDTMNLGNYKLSDAAVDENLITSRYYLTNHDALLKSYVIDTSENNKSWFKFSSINSNEVDGEFHLNFVSNSPNVEQDFLRPDTLKIERGFFKAKVERK